MAIVNSIFDLAAQFGEDNSIESQNYLRIAEESGVVTDANKRVLRWKIDDLSNFLLLSRSYIVLQMRWESSGAGYDATTIGPAFINNIARGIKRSSLTFNGQVVEVHNNYDREWKNILETLEYDSDYDLSAMSDMGYVPEIDDPITNTINDQGTDPDSNSSLEYRSVKQGGAGTGGRNMNFRIPLHKIFRFLSFYDKVLRSVSVEIEIELSPDTELLVQASVGGSGTNRLVAPAMAWHNAGAFLMAHRVVPSIQVRNNLNQMLSAGFKHSMQYTDFNVYRVALNIASSGQQDVRIATTVSRPVNCFVMFQRQSRIANQDESVTRYDTGNINRISLFVNGTPNPTSEYQPNWGNQGAGADTRGDRVRMYNDLLQYRGLTSSKMSDRLNYGTTSYDTWVKSPITVFSLNNVTDTEFQGASEISVSVDRHPTGISNDYMYVVIEYIKLAQISLSNIDSQILVN